MNLRCQALDSEGRQCRLEATWHEQYHGDNELYGVFNERPRWVKVAFCDRHAAENHVNKKPIRNRQEPDEARSVPRRRVRAA